MREEGSRLDSQEYAVLAAEAAAEKKAFDVAVIDVAELLVVTDYFVICTGANDRQVVSIADEVEHALKKEGLPAIGREGAEEGRWVLLDFADVVVHVFQPEERDFYRLERLWDGAPHLDLPAEVVNASVGASLGAVDAEAEIV
jgi:ribosome-associated protein